MVGESLLQTNLPVLEFEPGVRELTEEHKEMLKKHGQEIADDTETNYSICARVSCDELSVADSENLDNQELLAR